MLKECTRLSISSCCCSWWCWVRPAQSCIHNFLPTCSPCSRIFVLPLGGCAAAQLHTPACIQATRCCMVTDTFALLLAQSFSELTSHWLSEEKNSASIGCQEVKGCCDWSSSTAPSPWRLGLCKHPGCFFQWAVFTSSSVLPVCAD